MAREEAYLWDENDNFGYIVETIEDEPIAGEPLPKIEPGEYAAICRKTEVKNTRAWGRKIYFHFAIVGGKHDGTELFMSCNYPKGTLSNNYKYYRQWALANGGLPSRGQKLARNTFLNKKYIVLVRNSQCKHSNGELMADSFQYSVVDSIVKVIAYAD